MSDIHPMLVLSIAESGDYMRLRDILKTRNDIDNLVQRDFHYVTPLMVACSAQRLQNVIELLDAGASVNVKDDWSIPDSDTGRTALHFAASKGNVPIIDLLIKAGAEINISDSSGITPLALAASAHFDAVCFLISKGAVLNSKRRKAPSTTALLNSIYARRLDIFELLLKHGANPNEINRYGTSPLMQSVRRGDERMMNCLLDFKADVLYTEKDGTTALTCACRSSQHPNANIVSELLERGVQADDEILALAKKAFRHSNGMPARQEEYRKIVKLLSDWLATKVSPPLEIIPVSKPNEGPESSKDVDKWGELVEPDFSIAGQHPAYVQWVAELSKHFDTEAEKLGPIDEGWGFHLKQPDTDIEKVAEQSLQKGFSLFVTSGDNNVAILPTADKYQVLAAIQPNGQNYGIGPGYIIQWLKEMEIEHPFKLTGAGFDFVSGEFVNIVANPDALAEKMLEFCPDVSFREFKDNIEKKQFAFWWD